MTKPRERKFRIGQTLYFVPIRGSRLFETTISSVGHRWIYTTNQRLRVDKETLIADGGKYDSPGRCYTSKEEYDLHVKTMERWKDFKNMLAGVCYHDNLTLEDIEAMIVILKKR